MICAHNEDLACDNRKQFIPVVLLFCSNDRDESRCL